jgi:hypothetical protein
LIHLAHFNAVFAVSDDLINMSDLRQFPFMRRAISGFVCGYLMVALVVMPAIMLAFGRTATYGEGVRLVVNRSGVIERVRQGAHDVAQTRDRLLGELADYIDTKLSPHPADASNEAAKAVLVRQG